MTATVVYPEPAIQYTVRGARLTLNHPRPLTQYKAARVGSVRHTKPEDPYRDELAIMVGGVIELVLPFGRADVATSLDVWEVEPIRSWKHGVHQVLSYAAQSGLRPNVALIGPSTSRDQQVEIYATMRDFQPKVKLWVYGYAGWHTITSMGAARSSWSPRNQTSTQ